MTIFFTTFDGIVTVEVMNSKPTCRVQALDIPVIGIGEVLPKFFLIDDTLAFV